MIVSKKNGCLCPASGEQVWPWFVLSVTPSFLVIAGDWDWRGRQHGRGGRIELGGKEAMNNLKNASGEKSSHDFVICVVFYFIVLDADLDSNFIDVQNKSESTMVGTSQICM